jgi:protein tyrosine phosphatase (PTP) superfamily phosphohydrolase (DUF442 family)
MQALRYLTLPVLLVVAVVVAEEGTNGQPRPPVALDDHGDPQGLHRHRRWSERVGQGAQPEGEIAFENLAALGYTTVLSVDGSIPDVETARKHGLRYVHVPIGYDGVSADAAAKIVKAVKESKGPVYFHCHHGKHRGPAAAMIGRIAVDGISHEEAVEALKKSETSPDYKGLYRDVAAFECPSDDVLAKIGELPSKVVPEGLQAAMVDVDHRFELITLARAEGWKESPKHPDVDPPHEAKMLWERYRETARLEEAKGKGDAFLAFLAQAESGAAELEKAIRAGDAEAADKAYGQIKKSCNACHADFRN